MALEIFFNCFMQIFFVETTTLILLFKHVNEKLIFSKLKYKISSEKTVALERRSFS